MERELNNKRKKIIKKKHAGKPLRLDVFLTELDEIPSRSYGERLIKDKKVFVDGEAKEKSFKVKPGQEIEINLPVSEEKVLKPYYIDFDIKYQDKHLLVVSKPSGLVVHPSHGHKDDTLVNALIAKNIELSNVGPKTRPGIVHRLDKDTSGLMLVAKTNRAHEKLIEQIKKRNVKRVYQTLVCGNIYKNQFEIRAPITRSKKTYKKMAVDFGRGKEAYTYFDLLENFDCFTFLKARLGTGRTHQIRVHLSAIGHPVVKDPIYGGRKCARNLPLDRLFLHAVKLDFKHPVTGKPLIVEEDLPEELKRVLSYLQEKGRR